MAFSKKETYFYNQSSAYKVVHIYNLRVWMDIWHSYGPIHLQHRENETGCYTHSFSSDLPMNLNEYGFDKRTIKHESSLNYLI